MKTSRALCPTREPAPAIGIERIVDRKLPIHVLEVVAAQLAEAARHRVESPGLGHELAIIGVGAAHDEGQGLQGGIRQPILVEEGVEGPLTAMLPHLDTPPDERPASLPPTAVPH